MHILYLHQHFALPSGSTGTRSYEFARRWVKAGHQVTVICGRGDICGLPLQSEFEVEGVLVKVVESSYSQKQSFLRRMGSFLCFMISASFQGLRLKNIDIIYATSTPLTIGIPAMIVSRFRHIPFVFEVRDQWPRIPIEMGIIRNTILKKILLRLEKKIYRKAAAMVALSPGMAEGIHSVLGQAGKEVIVAPNSADTDFFYPGMDGSPVRSRMGWKDKFVIMHFGTMGRANGLDFLLDAADRLKSDRQILFVLLGSGREKERLQKKAADARLDNIQFVDSISKKELPGWVAACDVSTVIFAEFPILEHNSANKFFDSLAAGKPVLLNYSGRQRELLEKNQAGLGCKQADVLDYVQKVKYLVSQKEMLGQMGRNARRLAETEFSRDYLAAEVLKLLESAIRQKPLHSEYSQLSADC